MFAKNARWYFPGQDVQGVIHHIGGALYHAGITLAPSGPGRWEGIGTGGSYGLSPKLWISVMPDQGGFWLDVRLWADLDGGFLIPFVLMWMVCFPGAIIFLVLGNSSWTTRSNELLFTMQQPIAHLQSTPNWGHPPYGQ